VITGWILDVPAVMDLALRRTQYMGALAYVTAIRGYVLAVPATALAAAAADVDDPGRSQLAWAAESASVVVVPLDATTALDTGAVARQHLVGHVVHGQIAHEAQRRSWPILTDETGAARWRALGLDTETLP
jgi:hypothetical protein